MPELKLERTESPLNIRRLVYCYYSLGETIAVGLAAVLRSLLYCILQVASTVALETKRDSECNQY